MVQYYQYSADMGNADAATAIGRIFAAGAKGLRRDRRRAYRYFTQAAAARGDADAMSQLGHLFANGWGCVGEQRDGDRAVQGGRGEG